MSRPARRTFPSTLPLQRREVPWRAPADGAVAQFEERIAAPGERAVALVNSTLALELSLAALGLAPGARVLLASLSPLPVGTAVLRAGLTPVFADVDARSCALTPLLASAALDRALCDAVLAVSPFGGGLPAGEWDAFARDTGRRVLAVGVHAPPLTSVFSRGAGVVTTRDGSFELRVRALADHGISRGTVGTDARPLSLDAPAVPGERARLLAALDGLKLAFPDSPHELPVLLPAGVDAAAAQRALASVGVSTERFVPLHRIELFAPARGPVALPVTELLSQRLLLLPLHVALDADDVAHVAEALRAFLR